MKTRILCMSGLQIIAVSLGLVTANAFASPKTIDFATGQDSSGNIQLNGNSLDANWKESSNPENPVSTYVVAPGNADWGVGGALGPWLANGPNSAWIAPNPNDATGNSGTNGNLEFTYTFDLSGYDLTTASFANLSWTGDDAGVVELNGHREASLPIGSWTSLHDFVIPVNHLAPAVNALIVTVSSDRFVDGMRMEGTLTISPIPEPETYAMLLAGLGLVAFIARRARLIEPNSYH